MIPGLFNSDGFIQFEEERHLYNDIESNPYESVSRVLKTLKQPFDKKGISRMMAQRVAAETGGDVLVEQNKLLSEWDDKRITASDHGNRIHGALESYLKTGNIGDRIIMPVLGKLLRITDPKRCYRYFPEAIIYAQKYRIAGTSDLVIQRQRSKNSPFDFYDYKTNLSRGIVFHSMKKKDGDIRHYNRYLLPPLEHLEDSNYAIYSLQLSIYAFMAQLTWGIRVGRLGIIFINKQGQPKIYPVPYMKMEAQAVLEHFIKRKELPK